MADAFVALLMGSDSDLPVLEGTLDVLAGYGVRVETRVLSAHRTPEQTREFVADAEQRGCKVFICAAGLAAHLAGTVAAHTLKPVIGIPVDAGPLKGHDALLSTVQMPPGIPVACVAIGSAGAKNAGHLAAQMLALADPALAQRLADTRSAAAQKVLDQDRSLQEKLRQRA